MPSLMRRCPLLVVAMAITALAAPSTSAAAFKRPRNALTVAARLTRKAELASLQGYFGQTSETPGPQVVIRRCRWIKRTVVRCVAYVIGFEGPDTYDPTPPSFSASCPTDGGAPDPYCDPNPNDNNTPIPGEYWGTVCNASHAIDFDYRPPDVYSTGGLHSKCQPFDDAQGNRGHAIRQIEQAQDHDPTYWIA